MSYEFRFCYTDYVFCLLILILASLIKTNIISVVLYIILLYVIPICRLHIYLEIFTSSDSNSIIAVIGLLFLYQCHTQHLQTHTTPTNTHTYGHTTV